MLARKRFVILGQNGSLDAVAELGLRHRIEPFDAALGAAGGFAETYHISPSAPCPPHSIMKVLKQGRFLSRNVDLVAYGLRQSGSDSAWRKFKEEYDKLVSLNGLEGHAPLAYLRGLYVEDRESGEVLVRPAFIMQEITGAKSLHEVIVGHGERGFTTAEAVAFALRLLQIIELQEPLAHADLSGGNILVRCADGDTFAHLYVIDYGQSRYDGANVTPSGAGPRLATLPYAAPEIFPLDDASELSYAAEHQEFYDYRRDKITVDLWSLGALAYYVRTGEEPPLSVTYNMGAYYQNGVRISCSSKAFRALIEEKRRGLELPAWCCKSEADKSLSRAIACCTQSNPSKRSFAEIRHYLEEASRLCKTQTPRRSGGFSPDTPDLGEDGQESVGRGERQEGGGRPQTRVADARPVSPAGVYATRYKLYVEPGIAYSDKQYDVLVFRAAQRAEEELVVGGRRYYAKRVGDTLDMSNKRWSVKVYNSDIACDSPWREIERVLFLDKVAPKTLIGWFSGCLQLKVLEGLENLDTSNVRDMQFLFYGCTALKELDLSSFDTARVTQMNSMFGGCTALAHVDLSHFDTSSVVKMGWMFRDCAALAELDLSHFDTARVTDFQSMFDGCSSLRTLDLSGFDTRCAEKLNHMFYRCAALVGLNVSSFYTAAAKDMRAMFCGCSSLTRLDVSSFDASHADDVRWMFNDCASLERLYGYPFPINRVARKNALFKGSANLAVPENVWAAQYKLFSADGDPYSGKMADLLVFGQGKKGCLLERCVVGGKRYTARLVGDPLDMSYKDWTVRNRACDSPWQDVELAYFWQPVAPCSTAAWFAYCTRLRKISGIEYLDTSRVQSMRCMFIGCSSLVGLNLSLFNTAQVTDMAGMFCDCSALTELDLSQFDTSRVTDMAAMFNGCLKLREVDVTSFDTTRVVDMTGMFRDCRLLEQVDVSHFDTSSVESMWCMFADCSALKAVDVSHFVTSSASNMAWMFYRCRSLEEIDVSRFDVSRVTEMHSMFRGCSSLKTLNVTSFNAPNATSASWIFKDCTSLQWLDGYPFPLGKDAQAEGMLDNTPRLTRVKVYTLGGDNASKEEKGAGSVMLQLWAARKVAPKQPSRAAAEALNARSFDVRLTDKGKMPGTVIAAVRELTGLDALKSMRLVDSVPHLLLRGVDRARAQSACERIAEAGGTAEIIPSPYQGGSISSASSSGARAGSGAGRAEADPYAGVGRNDPCPCGSGKKFKNCHGRNR